MHTLLTYASACMTARIPASPDPTRLFPLTRILTVKAQLYTILQAETAPKQPPGEDAGEEEDFALGLLDDEDASTSDWPAESASASKKHAEPLAPWGSAYGGGKARAPAMSTSKRKGPKGVLGFAREFQGLIAFLCVCVYARVHLHMRVGVRVSICKCMSVYGCLMPVQRCKCTCTYILLLLTGSTAIFEPALAPHALNIHTTCTNARLVQPCLGQP